MWHLWPKQIFSAMWQQTNLTLSTFSMSPLCRKIFCEFIEVLCRSIFMFMSHDWCRSLIASQVFLARLFFCRHRFAPSASVRFVGLPTKTRNYRKADERSRTKQLTTLAALGDIVFKSPRQCPRFACDFFFFGENNKSVKQSIRPFWLRKNGV